MQSPADGNSARSGGLTLIGGTPGSERSLSPPNWVRGERSSGIGYLGSSGKIVATENVGTPEYID